MTTREEAKKMNPEESFAVGFFYVIVFEFTLPEFLINEFLRSIHSRKRNRVIMFEDGIDASGVWTPEEAGDVAARMVMGKSGNFEDPKLKKGVLRPLQYLGFVK